MFDSSKIDFFQKVRFLGYEKRIFFDTKIFSRRARAKNVFAQKGIVKLDSIDRIWEGGLMVIMVIF